MLARADDIQSIVVAGVTKYHMCLPFQSRALGAKSTNTSTEIAGRKFFCKR